MIQSDNLPPPEESTPRRHLPHFNEPGLIQGITFRLVDSMPAQRRAEWEQLLQIQQTVSRHAKIQTYIDNGYGSCILRQPLIADIVEACLGRHDKRRYRLLAWVVMPNHVHTLIRPLPGWELSEIVRDWKSYSAQLINVELQRVGSVWYRDYFDRYIRNDEHLYRATRYIHQNPVTAGLVAEPKDWLHSSARFVAEVDMTVCSAWE